MKKAFPLPLILMCLSSCGGQANPYGTIDQESLTAISGSYYFYAPNGWYEENPECEPVTLKLRSDLTYTINLGKESYQQKYEIHRVKNEAARDYQYAGSIGDPYPEDKIHSYSIAFDFIDKELPSPLASSFSHYKMSYQFIYVAVEKFGSYKKGTTWLTKYGAAMADPIYERDPDSRGMTFYKD